MKFNFKIQQYQTDAVEAVARVFQGQPYTASTSYMRDIGTLSNMSGQMRFLPGLEDDTQLEIEDLMSEIGYKNEALQLTDAQLLQNIRNLQQESNIHQSDALVAPLGRVILYSIGTHLLKDGCLFYSIGPLFQTCLFLLNQNN